MIKKEVLERKFDIILTNEQFTAIEGNVWNRMKTQFNLTIDEFISLYTEEINNMRGLN